MEEDRPGMTGEDIVRLANPFAHLMNQMQTYDGENIQDVVSAGLYALGCALAQMGAHIDVEAPVKDAITPLSVGYAEALDRLKRRMM